MSMSLPPPFDGRRAALVVGHPGHELRVHGWLELARPRVWVLTDGSGHRATGRFASTAALLARAGARLGSLRGQLSDREAYRLIVEGDVAGGRALVAELAQGLLADDSDYAACDAIEGFNPTHDLCQALVAMAAELVAARRGRALPLYDFPLDAAPEPAAAAAPGGLRLELDARALERKLAAAGAYREMRREVEGALQRFGAAAFAVERLRPAPPLAAQLAALPRRPYYEVHGERRVRAGHYSRVLRLEQHFLPFVERLLAAERLACGS
jgi:hypothetical protein